ncbi:hypothetical protein BOX15_Mlig016097g3 [Macrostomum lignano]|uniref:VWFD domain-containing protein n=2 Tax=Macrostomum lignano TaxID=282301 RepID=A0A267E1K3_9PLAT|nr:hypothetical protein BOX15_Mlig016097g3 [Macrostomum lignano]
MAAGQVPLLAALVCLAALSGPTLAHSDCYASVGGARGHIYQFDGGRVTANPALGGCLKRDLLLTRSFADKDASSLCELEILASFKAVGGQRSGLSRLSAVTVKVDGKVYRLLAGRKLTVNGQLKSVPHGPDKGVRIFFSGEDLVLAHKRCNFWVGFDGDWTATYWLSGKYRGKLEGLAGDCDGHGKDEVGSWLSEAGCRPVKRKPRCLSSAAKREAVHRCSRVINGKDGCFNREVLRPCIADACSAEGALRKKILCTSFYLQSRRCARHHKPLSWRHRSGCPIKCGPNEHFTSRASPCPATCGSHFFGTPKKCFHLPSAEGCRCKRGFVLDSSNRCVPPKECECLTKLCLDRMPRKKCLKWRARGRCKRYPEVMARFCRLTCGHCETRCGENQFSDKLCKNILRQGKCSKPLYKAVCAATCGRNKCRCPNKRRIESKCSTRYKNRIIKSIRYLPGPHGKCIKSTVVRYEPCGACPSIAKTKLQPCNYCKGVRTGKRTVQYRETHGKHRCLRRVTRVSKKCPCPPSGQLKVVSSRKCVKHTELVRVTKVFKAAEKCTKCKRITQRQVVKKIKCSGRRTVLKKCTSGRKHRKKLVYTKQARNCKCIWKLAKEQNLLCYCSKKRSVNRSCSNGYRIKKITGLRLKNNKCVRWVRQVKRKINCPERRHAKLICQRKTCKATKISSYYQLSGCKCSKKVVKRLVGKCCCPKGYKKIVRVDRYWKKLIKVQYLLEDHKCRKKTTTRKYRVACPPAKKEARCDKVTGAKVFTKIWYVLKNGDCVKRRSKRVARLHCLHGVYRHVGPCHRSGGKGVSRYRKVRYEYYRRKKGSCSCEKVRRTVKELCGCPQGNFVKTTKCPKTGCNSKKCGSKCHYTKTYFYFTKWSYDGDKHHKRKHCHAKVFKHIHFPCCCASNKRVKTWCRSHKHSVKQVTYTKLSKDKHECVRLRRTTTSRIRCKHNSEGTAIKKRLPHPKPGYYYIATYRWHVKNCRCLSTVAKRTCRKRCNPTKTSRRCNRVTGEWITRKVSWKLRGCRTCVQRVREARTPVHCRRKTKRTKRCDKKTGILTVTVTHWKRKGCKCVQKKRVTRRRCKCPKPIVGKRHCDHESSAYVTRTTYWLLKSGKCVKRRRVKVSQVTCSHSVKRKSVCKAKSGVKLVYIGVLKPKGCRCVRQWSLENRLRCNCNRENNEAKQDRRKYCDKHRNLKVTVTYRYVLKKGSCVRKRQKRYRAYSCPPSFTEKKKCDVKRRIQVTLTHYSVKRKCSCVRAVKRRSRKCGCAHKVRRKRYCRRAEGVVVTELHTERWSHKKERCIKKKTTKSHRVSCSQKTHYSVTKCIKNKHYVETKVYEVRKGCRCIKRRVKKRRNCHCKTITRKYKCPKAGFTRRIVTQIRRWDSAKKRCKTVRYVTRRIRCRCPAGGRKRLCRAGSWVTETISFALRHGRCYKRVKRRKQRVTCRHKIRRRYTACKKTGCKKRHIYTMKLKLDSKRCSCYYAVVKRIACPCCCPKTVKHPKRCVKDGKAWQQVTVGYRVLSGKKCGCKRWLKRKTRPVACTKLRQLVWQPCDRHKCISHQRKVHHVVHGCRCRKISRLTGKKRVCCCRGKTKRKRFCRRSAIYERVTLVRLRNWRCVRIKQLRLLRSWHCKAKRKTVVGKCDRTTCKQPLHTLVYKVSRPHCRCRRVAIKRRHRTCCCLQRPKRTKRCDSATAAWVHTRVYYVFNASKHVCVRRRSTVRTPVRCSKHVKQKKDGSCNRHTCRRVVKQIDHYVHHCRCRRRVKRVSKVCCCPRAKRLPVRCDRSKHQWLRSKITWHLSHGRCVKRVTTKRHQLTCRRDVKTRVLACSRRTCKRKIVKILHRPKGCRCAIRHKITHRTCCCRPAVRSNVKCVNDRDVVRITKRRVFNRHTYKCKTKVVKKLLHRLHKCRNTIYRSKCNKKTRHRTVRKVLRRPKKCRCKVYRRVTHRVLCSCPNTRVKRTKCSKTSCHKSIVKTWYTSSGHGAHFKCRKHRQVIKVRCCCKRNPTSRVYCDRSSGATKRESKWTVFIASRRACVRRRKVVLVRRLACKRGGCKLGKCNKSTGYRIKVCVSYKPLRHKCSCKKRTVKRKIICHCPKSYTKKFCKGDERKLEVRTSWKISRLENRCVKRVKTITNHLECPKRRWREKKCPTKPDCQGKITTNWYQLKKCRCKRITRSKPIVCCCPKPTRVKRCLENQWVTVLTKHNLFKGHCLQKVKRIRVSVRCKRKRVRIGRCRKDCKKHRVILLYEVKNCKCAIAKRIIRTKMCCCPRPKHYKRCKAAKGVVQNIKQFWRLSHGKCLKRRRIVSRKIVCPKGSTRASKCNRHTRKQKVVIVRYSRVACRCHRRKRIRQLLCMCRPPRTVKEKCTSERIKRRVYRITYHLSHPRSKLVKRHCLKRRKVWYTEPCRCPKPTRRQRCSRKGTVLTTKIRKWRLKIVKRLHHRRWIRRRTCVLKITKKHTRIRCKRRSVSWTKCRNFRRKRTTVKHWVHRCKCRRRAVVRVFACNCAKKSTKSRRCDAKAGDLVYTRKSCYSKRGAATCSCTTRRWRKHINCPRRYVRRRLTKRHCGLKRHRAWYNRFSIEWTKRRGCGCVRKRRTVLRFCHCQRGSKRAGCAINGKTWVKTKVTYRPSGSKHGGCKKVKRVTKRRILCRRHAGKPKVKIGGCSKHCKRSVSVRQCYVKNCRRKLYIQSRLQLCCKPKPKRHRYCEKKSGKWVTKTLHYKLVPSGPC